mmetsp:Transcript_165471/g.530960  ORF Transcript_165471/g.530960 Transcript_165471/m.530960 type:complete len:209 (+) Transcript_165471:1287-1913(+)
MRPPERAHACFSKMPTAAIAQPATQRPCRLTGSAHAFGAASRKSKAAGISWMLLALSAPRTSASTLGCNRTTSCSFSSAVSAAETSNAGARLSSANVPGIEDGLRPMSHGGGSDPKKTCAAMVEAFRKEGKTSTATCTDARADASPSATTSCTARLKCHTKARPTTPLCGIGASAPATSASATEEPQCILRFSFNEATTKRRTSGATG